MKKIINAFFSTSCYSYQILILLSITERQVSCILCLCFLQPEETAIEESPQEAPGISFSSVDYTIESEEMEIQHHAQQYQDYQDEPPQMEAPEMPPPTQLPPTQHTRAEIPAPLNLQNGIKTIAHKNGKLFIFGFDFRRPVRVLRGDVRLRGHLRRGANFRGGNCSPCPSQGRSFCRRRMVGRRNDDG